MVDRVLKLLAHFATRPGMYVQPVQPATVQSYLHGLETAVPSVACQCRRRLC